MNKIATLGTLLTIALLGCTRHYRVEGLAVEGNQVTYNQGYAIAAIDGPDVQISCAICQRQPDNERLTMAIRIVNKTSKALDFVPEMVLGVLNGHPNHLFTQDALLEEEESRYNWEQFGQVLAATVNNLSADQAGYTRQTGSYSQYGQYSGCRDRGSFSASGGWQSQTYNSTDAFLAKSIANFQNAQMFANSSAAHLARMAAIRNQVLTRATIAPSQSIEGLMIFEGLPGRKCRQSESYSFEVFFPHLRTTPCRFLCSRLP
jgi:hypothetical protein